MISTFEEFLAQCRQQYPGYCRNTNCHNHNNFTCQYSVVGYANLYDPTESTYCIDCMRKWWDKNCSPQVIHARITGMKPQERQLLLNIYRGMTPWVALSQSGTPKQNVYYLFKWTGRGWYSYGVNVCCGWLTRFGKEIASQITENVVDAIVIVEEK